MQVIQYGTDGPLGEVTQRVVVNSTRLSTGVLPEGSTLTRTPIPPCDDIPGLGWRNHQSPKNCQGPMWPSPVKEFGYGVGSCCYADPPCTQSEYQAKMMPYSIVDTVKVPDVPAGDYIIQFRYDTEHMPQVWGQCADVQIRAKGTAKPTKPFSSWRGCEACCEETLGSCANCSKCINDKSGDCAYCWTPLAGEVYRINVPIQCLGHEASDGGPGPYVVGSEIPAVSPMSPGCSKCWREEGSCKPRDRETVDDSLIL